MTIKVPTSFAASLRNRRLLGLSLLASLCFLAGIFFHSEFAYAGCPLVVYILIIVASYDLPLSYRITQRGICLSTPNALVSLPLCLATNFWVSWLFDRVTTVEHTHFEESPALLIRTKYNQRGTLLPVDRVDAEPVAMFLSPSNTESGANAFS